MIENSAGGILLNIDRTKFYAIHKTVRNEWLLPKGKIEEGESPQEAAFREVAEETGYYALKLYDEKKEFVQQYTYKTATEVVEKTVVYYVFQITQDIQFNTLSMKKEGLGGKWVTPDEFITLIEGTITHDLAKIIRSAHDVFRYS